MASWGRETEPDVAEQRILAAAEKAFVELGVPAAGMSEIAEFAGCSRGTLYRYFRNRHDLHLAYIEITAHRIVERVRKATASLTDPGERALESIRLTLREVRSHPATMAWFDPSASGMAARMSRNSEVTTRLTQTFVREFGAGDGTDARLRARFLERMIVSFLSVPEPVESDERELIDRFLAPALLSERSNSRS